MEQERGGAPNSLKFGMLQIKQSVLTMKASTAHD